MSRSMLASLISDGKVTEKTLRERYVSQFEIAVKVISVAEVRSHSNLKKEYTTGRRFFPE